MKTLIALLAVTLPLSATEIIIKPAEGKGEAVKVDVSGPAKIVLGGKAYHIEPAEKSPSQIRAEKLIIPSINFEEVTVEDAAGFLNNRRAEIRDVEDRPIAPSIVTHGKFPKCIDALRVRDVSFHEALRLIALKTGATIEYRANVVVIIGEE